MRHELSLSLGPCSACGEPIDCREIIGLHSLPVRLPGKELDAEVCFAMGVCPACQCFRWTSPSESTWLAVRAVLVRLGWKLRPLVCAPASACLPFDWI